ncbi:hypothetical protein ACTMU2_17935 [Cupriavidus basilensis]
MGDAGRGKMTTHQQKKLDRDDLISFRNRFQLPLTDEQTEALHFFKPAQDSDEMRYLHARREALGGCNRPFPFRYGIPSKGPCTRRLRTLRYGSRWQGNVDHDGLRTNAQQPAKG